MQTPRGVNTNNLILDPLSPKSDHNWGGGGGGGDYCTTVGVADQMCFLPQTKILTVIVAKSHSNTPVR